MTATALEPDSYASAHTTQNFESNVLFKHFNVDWHNRSAPNNSIYGNMNWGG
jgi:hypothetical protein